MIIFKKLSKWRKILDIIKYSPQQIRVPDFNFISIVIINSAVKQVMF